MLRTFVGGEVLGPTKVTHGRSLFAICASAISVTSTQTQSTHVRLVDREFSLLTPLPFGFGRVLWPDIAMTNRPRLPTLLTHLFPVPRSWGRQRRCEGCNGEHEIVLDAKIIGRMGRLEGPDRDVECTLEAERGLSGTERGACVSDRRVPQLI